MWSFLQTEESLEFIHSVRVGIRHIGDLLPWAKGMAGGAEVEVRSAFEGVPAANPGKSDGVGSQRGGVEDRRRGFGQCRRNEVRDGGADGVDSEDGIALGGAAGLSDRDGKPVRTGQQVGDGDGEVR